MSPPCLTCPQRSTKPCSCRDDRCTCPRRTRGNWRCTCQPRQCHPNRSTMCPSRCDRMPFARCERSLRLARAAPESSSSATVAASCSTQTKRPLRALMAELVRQNTKDKTNNDRLQRFKHSNDVLISEITSAVLLDGADIFKSAISPLCCLAYVDQDALHLARLLG